MKTTEQFKESLYRKLVSDGLPSNSDNEKWAKDIMQKSIEFGKELSMKVTKSDFVDDQAPEYDKMSYVELNDIYKKLRKEIIKVDGYLRKINNSISKVSDKGCGSYIKQDRI